MVEKLQYINTRKLIRMSVLAFENGLRLHEDAILLYRNESYPTAYLVSVLSMEEFGKSLALEDYLWNSSVNGKAPPKLEREFIDALYNHKFKQKRFARNLDIPGYCRKAIQNIFDGHSETMKHASTYVGLYKVGRKIDYKGKIINPLKFNAKKAFDQLTVVNDFIVVLALGCIKGTHSMDLVGLEELFTHELVISLKEKWPDMSKSSKQQFLQIEKYEDMSLEERGITNQPSGR